MRPSIAFIDMTVTRHVVAALAGSKPPRAPGVRDMLGLTPRVQRYQGKNVYVRGGGLDWIKWMFGFLSSTAPNSGFTYGPWRPPASWDGSNLNTRAAPTNPVDTTTNGAGYPTPIVNASGTDSVRHRQGNSIADSLLSTDVPRVIGHVFQMGQQHLDAVGLFANGLAVSEVAVTQIGVGYVHPCFAFTASWTLGNDYITSPTWLTNAAWLLPHMGNYLRINQTGADKGIFKVRHLDWVNSRVYLANLDNTRWVAQTTQVGGAIAVGPEAAYYNQVSVIPNSVGTVTFDGIFAPGENRTSYLYRLFFEKSGSPSPADASQKGTYWFMTRPYTYGDGAVVTNTDTSYRDCGGLMPGRMRLKGPGSFFPTATANPELTAGGISAGFVGSCPGLFLDRTNQRLWGTASDGTNGDIWWWLYKSPETVHEVATTTGTPNDAISGITMTGAVPRAIDGDDENTVYVALYGGANAGVVKITSGLVATQWLSSSAALGANVSGLKVDRTRARTSAANTVTTTAATGNMAVTGGAFTQADLGRAIKITSGVDAGTYKISVVTDATNITVTTLAGAAVSFTGQAATGAAQIGSRIYIFFNDTTSWAGGLATQIDIVYMESLAFGTVLRTGNLAVTSGTGRTLYNGERQSSPPDANVDPQNGNLYWVSSDTATTLNRYDVTAQTVSQKALSTFTTPTGGGGTITTPTIIHAVGVNPHASFREVWVATNQGWIEFSATVALSALTAADYKRYQGRGDSTGYTNPANNLRPDGDSWLGSPSARDVFFGVDGKVWGAMQATSGTGIELVTYNRDVDLFTTAWDAQLTATHHASLATAWLMTPYGEVVHMQPTVTMTAGASTFGVLSAPTCYQWIGAAWVAKDVQRGALPDSTSSPGLSCKDLHTTLDNLLYGVRVKFTPQGGATPANNEFIGRLGLTGAQRADGAVTIGSGIFTGSGFSSADVGRYLRIEKVGGDTVNNADVDVYLITAFTDANNVTLKRVSGNGAAWTATASGTCHYTVWDQGTFGPECATVTGYNGFGKDNTQDITNILYEVHLAAKTVVSENVEGVKAACGIIGPAGSAGASVYRDFWTKATSGYNPGIPQGLGMPAALTKGEQLLMGLVIMGIPDGTNGKVDSRTTETSWGGFAASANGTTGLHYAVDLGADAEVGSVIVRLYNTTNTLLATDTNANGGLLANLHRALAAGGTPVAASAVRLTGANISLPLASTTATLGAADFMGAISASAADGAVSQGGNVITSAAGRFTGREGQVVRLTSGADQGYYRIVSVDGTGAQATVRKLDQTVVSFSVAAAGLSFDIHANAVREDDILAMPSGVGTHKVTVERLLTTTTAQVRESPTVAISAASWDALIPTWTLVKRVAHSVMAAVPNVANNGTYVAEDGRDRSDLATAVDSQKVIIDLTDLTTAQRTGRYWKFSMMPRWAANGSVSNLGATGIEFYDPTGKRVDHLPNNKLDTVDTLANFLGAHVQRIDWIQATNAAASHIANVNGNADLGGARGDTVTLNTAGNKFLGHQVRAGANLSAPGANNTFNTTVADPLFTSADVGRLFRVVAGANAGYYRVATVPSTTSITVVTPAGNPVTLNADAGPTAWTLHEGINVGASNYDYMTIGGVDVPISTISDDLVTITLGIGQFTTLTNVAWEIRRRAMPAGAEWTNVASTVAGVDATKSARIVYSGNEFAQQVGDFVQDGRGSIANHSLDIGTPVVRADGSMAGGNGVFTGSGFNADDVNRILVISTGNNVGHYRISVYTNATTITVVNARTGAAVSFAADAGPRSYKVMGERRFKISRYVSILRS